MWATTRVVIEVLILAALLVFVVSCRRQYRALKRTREALAQLAEHTIGLPDDRPLPIAVQTLIREYHRQGPGHRRGRADRARTPD